MKRGNKRLSLEWKFLEMMILIIVRKRRFLIFYTTGKKWGTGSFLRRPIDNFDKASITRDPNLNPNMSHQHDYS